MATSDLLTTIANNVPKVFNAGYGKYEKEITDDLDEILLLQDSYINPKVSFTFNGAEYTLLEKEAYWTDKLSFPADWSEQPLSIWNDNGYSKWDYYTIVDSQNNLVKYNEMIKNSETYLISGLIEFFIQCDDGNKYTIKVETWGLGVDLTNVMDDSRFTVIRDEFGLYSGCYFTPEENGKKYLIPVEYTIINLGDIIEATLVEGGNE